MTIRLIDADAPLRHRWHCVAWGYWCKHCDAAIMDSEILSARRSGNREPIDTLLETLAESPTHYVSDLRWWTHR